MRNTAIQPPASSAATTAESPYDDRVYRILVEHSSDGIVIANEEGLIIEWNPRQAQLTGLPREAALGRYIWDVQYDMAPPATRARETRERVEAFTRQLLRTGRAPGIGQFHEREMLRPDGERCTITARIEPVPLANGYLIVGTLRDVTDLRRADQALRDSEAQFRTAFDKAAIGKALVGIDGRFLRVNDALCRMLGYSQQQLLQRTFLDITYPNDDAISREIFEEIRSGHTEVGSVEKRYRRSDGSLVWVVVSSAMIRDAQGRPLHLISEIQDITERRQAEIAQQESELKYRQLFDLESDAIVLIDNETGNILEANPAACLLYGYSHAELLRMKNTDVSAEPEETRQAVRQSRELILVRWHRNRSGRVFPVEITARHILWHGHSAHLAAIRDITARRQAEEQLRLSEQRYRVLVETSPDAIVLARLDGHILWGNQRAATLAGLQSAEQLIGQSVIDMVAPAQRERVRINLQHVITSGGQYSEGYTGLRPDGGTRPIEISAATVYDADGTPTALVAIMRDVTERHQAQALLELRHRDLAEVNAELQARNEELDAFAHTVAHDLKNPLHLVIGFAETLSLASAQLDTAEAEDGLLHIARAGRKMNNIIDELLLLAEVRKKHVQMQPIDLGRIVIDAQQRLTDLLRDSAAVIVQPDSWPIVAGYAPWVEEVWVNYLSNALKYGGRPPRIELGADLLPGQNQARLWVRDNGNGIAPQIQPRLFRAFDRLEQVQTKGYGLGLSIVRRIVERMGGQVGVVSTGESGQGALFFFTLPLTD